MEIVKGVRVLAGRINLYNNVEIKTCPVLPPSEFKEILLASEVSWREDKIKAAWIDLTTAHAQQIPVLVENGFKFHNAWWDSLVMNKWFLNSPSVLPNPATHYAGIGGLVLDRSGNALLVKEMYDSTWKIPGGLVDPGETLAQAVEREVVEETGVRCRFLGLLGFREREKYISNRQDIYFVSLLEPLEYEINQCSIEISKCEWIPFKPILETVRNEGFRLINGLLDHSSPETIKDQLLKRLLIQHAYDLEWKDYKGRHYSYY